MMANYLLFFKSKKEMAYADKTVRSFFVLNTITISRKIYTPYSEKSYKALPKLVGRDLSNQKTYNPSLFLLTDGLL